MTRRGMPVSSEAAPAIGSIDWLFREYRQSKAYTEKVGIRSRTGYEWAMRAVCNTDNKKGIRIGTLPIRSITPSAADSLYEKFITTDDGEKLRRGEKLTVLCRKAWRVVHRLFPAEFAKDIPNPWPGTTMKTRVVQTKPAATRAQVYAKRTAPRMLAATRKRHAHALANQAATSIQNGQETAIQNEKQENTKSA